MNELKLFTILTIIIFPLLTIQNIDAIISDNLPPLKQLKLVNYFYEVKCNDNKVLIIKQNSNTPACVEQHTKEILINRGWAKNSNQMIEDIKKIWMEPNVDHESLAVQITMEFIATSPTFTFDGIPNSFQISKITIDETMPPHFRIEADFDSKNSGYGDRTNTKLIPTITNHKIILNVSVGNITSAIVDEKWDELNQKLIES